MHQESFPITASCSAVKDTGPPDSRTLDEGGVGKSGRTNGACAVSAPTSAAEAGATSAPAVECSAPGSSASLSAEATPSAAAGETAESTCGVSCSVLMVAGAADADLAIDGASSAFPADTLRLLPSVASPCVASPLLFFARRPLGSVLLRRTLANTVCGSAGACSLRPISRISPPAAVAVLSDSNVGLAKRSEACAPASPVNVGCSLLRFEERERKRPRAPLLLDSPFLCAPAVERRARFAPPPWWTTSSPSSSSLSLRSATSGAASTAGNETLVNSDGPTFVGGGGEIPRTKWS